jgi:ABC-type nitrate/sulfonate/bicarbonate transport system substrate-binding protein
MTVRSSLAALAAAFAMCATLSPVKAADIPIVFALPSSTLTFTSVFIAEDAGFFKAEGLKLEFRNLVGVASNNAVIGGAADFSVGTAATFLRGAAQGQRMFAIANMVDRPMVELVLRKDVADAAGIKDGMPAAEKAKALKGKTIAVQGIGSIVHAMQRLVARMGGLDPDKDMTVVSMEPPAMVAALKSKQIDGYTTSMPFSTQSIVNGSAVVIASGPGGDLPDYTPTNYAVLYTRPEVCVKERVKCEKMGRAFKAANNFIHDKPDETWAILKKRFATMDEKLLAAAWEVTKKAHPRDVSIQVPALVKSQKFSLDAGLLEAKDTLSDFKGLYTDEFVK